MGNNMFSFKLAVRNLCRNRMRTIITFLGISLSLALVQTYHNFTTGVYSYMVECGVRSGAGHIALSRSGYMDGHDPFLTFAPGSLPGEMAALPEVQTVLARVHLTGLAQSGWGSRRVQVVGTDILQESRSNPFLRKIPKDIFSGIWNPQDALVGVGLLKELKLGSGRPLILTVQSRSGDLVSERFRVRGIIESGIRDVDDGLIMLAGNRAAQMAGVPGEVHEMSLVLTDADAESEVLPIVDGMLASRPRLQAWGWEKTMPNLYSAIQWDYTGGIVLSVILLLIVTFGVANTLLMSVMERFREFGMIRAVGASGSIVRRMILAEALLLGSIAMLAGSLVASAATWYLSVHGFDLRPFIPENLEFGGVLFSALLYAKWDMIWMAKSALFMIFLCLCASVYPALKVTQVSPVTALRCH